MGTFPVLLGILLLIVVVTYLYGARFFTALGKKINGLLTPFTSEENTKDETDEK